MISIIDSPCHKQETKIIYAAIGYIFITFILMSPTVRCIGTSLPDLGDSLHNIWTWGDNLNRIRDGRSLFDANILYPLNNTGTFQELQPLNTALYGLIHLFSDNPVLAYNILLLTSFFFTALFTYIIALILSGHAGLAFIAGIFTAFFPYRFAHLPHVQILSFFWVLIPLFFLIKYFNTNKSLYLVLFFVLYSFQIVGIGYNTVFLILMAWGYLLVAVVYDFYLKRLSRTHRRVFTALILAFVVAIPFYAPFINAASQGFSRGINELNSYGLDLALLSSAPDSNILYGQVTEGLRSFRPDGSISSVFPGFLFLFLLILSVAHLRSQGNQLAANNKSYDIIFIALGAVLFLGLAFGPVIKLRGESIFLSPIFLLFKFVPAFSSTRYLPDYIQPAVFCFSVGIAIILSNSCYFKRSIISRILVALMVMIVMFEYRANIPVSSSVPVGHQIPPVYLWLQKQTHSSIIELPIPSHAAANAPAYMDQFLYMYYSIYHAHRIVNGVTGFFPPELLDMMRVAQTFPSNGFLRFMHEKGVKYIVVHYDKMTGIKSPEEILKSYPQLSMVYNDSNTSVFKLNILDEFMEGAYQSKNPGLLKYEIIEIESVGKIKPGSAKELHIKVRNMGDTIWLSDTPDADPPGKGEVRVGVLGWVRLDGGANNMLIADGRGKLPFNVYPGEEVDLAITVKAPSELGSYKVRLNLVSELVQWFSEKPIEILFVVE